MTYQEFLDIQYEIDKEEDYYCWVCSTRPYSKENEEKFAHYRERQKKITEFKRKVLSEALKNLSKDYFK